MICNILACVYCVTEAVYKHYILSYKYRVHFISQYLLGSPQDGCGIFLPCPLASFELESAWLIMP